MSTIIGIGTDITECLRIARMIERHGELFINRVYNAEEIRYCQNRKQATQHFAGRWSVGEGPRNRGLGIELRGVERRAVGNGGRRLPRDGGDCLGDGERNRSLRREQAARWCPAGSRPTTSGR